VGSLHVEYLEQRTKCGILFIFSLFSEYNNLEYVPVPVMYRVNQAEYAIHILVAASQEYVTTYSTRRVGRACEGGWDLYRARVNPNPDPVTRCQGGVRIDALPPSVSAIYK